MLVSITIAALSYVGVKGNYGNALKIDGVQMDTLTAVLGQELLFLHVPLTPETHHLIGRATEPCLATGALIVNMSRRNVVDHVVMGCLLESGAVGAYASDVLDPLRDADLIRRGNVIATPHLGAQTGSTQQRIAWAVCDVLRRHVALDERVVACEPGLAGLLS